MPQVGIPPPWSFAPGSQNVPSFFSFRYVYWYVHFVLKNKSEIFRSLYIHFRKSHLLLHQRHTAKVFCVKSVAGWPTGLYVAGWPKIIWRLFTGPCVLIFAPANIVYTSAPIRSEWQHKKLCRTFSFLYSAGVISDGFPGLGCIIVALHRRVNGPKD